MSYNKPLTYYFGITDENSIYCGEEFFVEAFNYKQALNIASETFPNENLKYYGIVSDEEAEIMGLDTY